MVYYKIPLTGGLNYPAGCVLVCAYTYGGYEYCKFEKVTEVGSNWVAITESEFNVRCPEFPEPAITHGPLILVEGRDYGNSVPSNLAKGQVYLVKVVK